MTTGTTDGRTRRRDPRTGRNVRVKVHRLTWSERKVSRQWHSVTFFQRNLVISTHDGPVSVQRSLRNRYICQWTTNQICGMGGNVTGEERQSYRCISDPLWGEVPSSHRRALFLSPCREERRQSLHLRDSLKDDRPLKQFFKWLTNQHIRILQRKLGFTSNQRVKDFFKKIYFFLFGDRLSS